MGMYATKHTAEEASCLRIAWLKEHDFFCGYNSGGITWTWNYGGESSIGFVVDVTDASPSIRFQYSIKRWNEEESKSMDYSFPLVKVPCNLGGFRWAFLCALWKNNRYCGRRAYKLYRANSDYFGCRSCVGIVYDSQRDSGRKYEYLGNILKAEKKANEISQTMRKMHYRGKPTKKALKLEKLLKQIPPISEAPEIFLQTFFS